MSLIKKAIVSSGVLFGGCWLSAKILQACINEILVKATLDSLDDEGIQKDIYEYLNNILENAFNDSNFKENIMLFYEKVTFDTKAKEASKKLMAITLKQSLVLAQAVKTINLTIKNKALKDLTIHDKSFKAEFQ
jgi:hypothetical protein